MKCDIKFLFLMASAGFVAREAPEPRCREIDWV